MKRLTLTLTLTLLLAGRAGSQPSPNTLTQVGHYPPPGPAGYYGMGHAFGDFNADGYDEMILGTYTPWENDVGINNIFPGGPQFPPMHPTWVIHGRGPYESYDVEDKNLGDINGDGIEDFCIAATAYAGYDTSRLDIYFGHNPLDTIPDWTWHPPYTPGYIRFSIDSCGDVNRDGGKDFIVKTEPETGFTSRVFIFFGGSQLDTIPDWSISTPGNMKVVGLGDINGDGFSDVMTAQYNGMVKIYFGGNPMDTIPDVVFDHGYLHGWAAAGVRDVNADGYNDVALSWVFSDSGWVYPIYDVVYFGGPDMDNQPDVLLRSWDGAYSRSTYELSVGDFNGDGYGDIIGTPIHEYGEYSIHIWLGGPNFNSIPDAWIYDSYLHGFGAGIGSGDVNGDGRDELLDVSIGDPYPDGQVYLYQGPETWVDAGSGVINPHELQRTPGWFSLTQNYPNPFNSSTSIHFDLGKKSNVSLSIFDLQGKKVKALLVGKEMLPGGFNVSWLGTNELNQPVSSGIYLLELKVDQYRQIKKMALLR